MSAIILDGQLKSALAAVRSLGKAGVTVSVGAERETGMALHSKYTNSKFVYPSPYTNRDAFIRAVKDEAVRQGGKPVVYAFSDATYLSLYKSKDELEEYVTLVFPDPKSVEIAYDKSATYSLARVSGIPTITTHTPETKEEVELLSTELTYPAVIKTRRSVTWKDGKGIFGTATFIQNAEELKNCFFLLKEKLGESPVVQNFLHGEEYGVEMLAQEGKIFALVTHHRIRSLSPTGGASVLKETLRSGELKESLENYAQILVEKLKWSGPIMVEFKVDSDTRKPYLMEINGRFWGSLPLSIFAGVDMPCLYYKYATEKEIPPQICIGREGIVSDHFLGDVRNLFRVLFANDPMRKVLYPSRFQAIKNFCLIPLGTKGDVWSTSDLKPSWMEIVDILKQLWK